MAQWCSVPLADGLPAGQTEDRAAESCLVGLGSFTEVRGRFVYTCNVPKMYVHLQVVSIPLLGTWISRPAEVVARRRRLWKNSTAQLRWAR